MFAVRSRICLRRSSKALSARFDMAEKIAEARHYLMLPKFTNIRQEIARLVDAFQIDKRLSKLEEAKSSAV